MKTSKIYKKEKIHNGMYIMKCPVCGSIASSASEWELLPEFTFCNNKNCDY